MLAGGRLIICALGLALLSCNANAELSATSLNNICLLVKDGTMLASQSSCSLYYTCINGIATSTSCPIGYSFSKDSQSCLPQSQVNCLTSGQNPCLTAAVGSWVGVPGSCSAFYYCSANGAELSNCPTNENFDPTTQTCVYNTQYPCADTVVGSSGNSSDSTAIQGINLCSYIPNSVYFGNPFNCAAWGICNGNVMTSGDCPTGYNYNPSLQKCDYVADVTCTQVSNDPSLNTGVMANGGVCNSTQSSLTKGVINVCNYYYQCNGYYYQLLQCPVGYFFDTPSGQCVLRINARNPCDRCVGSTKSFVNSYSNTNCTNYLYCVNGIEAGFGACPLGQFFDEQDGACITTPTEPDFGCCNPQFYGNSTTASSNTTAPATNSTTTTVTPAPSTTTTTTPN